MGFKPRNYYDGLAKVVSLTIYCPNLKRNVTIRPEKTSMADPYYHSGLFDDCSCCGSGDLNFYCKCGEIHYVIIGCKGF